MRWGGGGVNAGLKLAGLDIANTDNFLSFKFREKT